MHFESGQSRTGQASYIDDLEAPSDKQVCKYHTLSSILMKYFTADGEAGRQFVKCVSGLCSTMGEYAEDLLAAYQEDYSQAFIIERIHAAEDPAAVLEALKRLPLASTRQAQAIVFYGVIKCIYHKRPDIEKALGIPVE